MMGRDSSPVKHEAENAAASVHRKRLPVPEQNRCGMQITRGADYAIHLMGARSAALCPVSTDFKLSSCNLIRVWQCFAGCHLPHPVPWPCISLNCHGLIIK